MKLTVEALLQLLFEDRSHPLFFALAEWLRRSRRFREFSEQNALKIRSKLRNPLDRDALQDLLFELETAAWLLHDKRFSLAYEEHGVRNRRGADFVVTFTSKLSFGVEVTRLHFPALEELDDQRQAWRIGNIIASKLPQMNKAMGNLLVIGVATERLQRLDLTMIMKQLKRRAEEKDEVLLNRSELGNPSAFFKQYQLLSGVVLRNLPAATLPLAPLLWTNKDGRFPLPSPILTALKENSETVGQ